MQNLMTFCYAAQFRTGSLALPESLFGPVVPFPLGTALQIISFDLHGSDDRAKTTDLCGLLRTEPRSVLGQQ